MTAFRSTVRTAKHKGWPSPSLLLLILMAGGTELIVLPTKIGIFGAAKETPSKPFLFHPQSTIPESTRKDTGMDTSSTEKLYDRNPLLKL